MTENEKEYLSKITQKIRVDFENLKKSFENDHKAIEIGKKENELLQEKNKYLMAENERLNAYVDQLMENEVDAGGEIEQLQIENAKIKTKIKELIHFAYKDGNDEMYIKLKELLESL